MVKKVNVALIGYKFMGKAHSHAIKDMPFFFKTNLKPVRKVICGRTEPLVKQAAEDFGWESYDTLWKRVIERKDIDLVIIATPNNLHHDIAIAAARSGKHILCEKPLATSLQEAREMLDVVRKTGVKHMVGFNYRRVPAISFAKKLIEEGKIGKVYHLRAVYLQDWLINPEFPVTWKLKKETAGSGPHGDLNAHLIDLARYFIGEFDKVMGINKTFVRKRPKVAKSNELTTMLTATKGEGAEEVSVDDATLFLAEFKNGALGSFEATRLALGRRNYQSIEINGSKGSMVFNLERMNELQFYSTEDSDDIQGFRTILVTQESHPYIKAWWPPGHIIGYEHTFIHQLADLANSIAYDEIPTPNFVDGVKCQEVLEAVDRSITVGKWVRVEEV